MTIGRDIFHPLLSRVRSCAINYQFVIPLLSSPASLRPSLLLSLRSRGSFVSLSRLFSMLNGLRTHRRLKSKRERERGGQSPVDGAATTGGGPVRPARITFVTIARLNNLETCIHGGCGTQWARDARARARTRARAVTDGFTIGPRR